MTTATGWSGPARARAASGLLALAVLAGLACRDDVVIEPKVAVGVTVSPPEVTVAVGGVVRLQAAARDADGVAFAGPEILWSSDAPAVATVSPRGQVTGVSPGTATVTAEVDGLLGTATVTVTLAPAIGLSRASVAFEATEGSADPPLQVVTISNAGAGALGALGTAAVVHAAGEPTGWLTGALVGSPDTLVLRASVAGLTAGTYQARLPLVADDASNSPQNVVATLTVREPAPEMVLSASFLSFLAYGGGTDPAPQSIAVSNAGTGDLTGLAIGTVTYAEGQASGWLSASVADSTVTVQAATGSLAPGTYLATVQLTLPGAVNDPQLIIVGFTVGAEGPAIGLSAATLDFAGRENGADPPAQTVDVVNIGADALGGLTVGAISYGPGQPTGWLSATLSSASAPASLVVQPTTAGLVSGVYTATVPVESGVAVNSPQSIAVAFELGGSDSLRFIAGGAAATVGTLLAPSPAVLVVDALGDPVVGRPVTFTASGSGSVSRTVDTTDVAGVATVEWTLGTAAGTDSDTLTATLPGGLSTQRVATAIAGLPVQLAVAQEPGGAVSYAPWAIQPAVQVQDVYGNPVAEAGLDVAAALSQGTGTLGGPTTATTDASGRATFTALLVTDADSLMALGDHALTFTSGTLNPATSASFTVAVSFGVNVRKVFNSLEGATATTCLACHSSFSSAANLVGQPTVIWAGCGTLVIAGDAANSILYRKVVDDAPPCGARMPNPGDKLSGTRADIIRDWILQGAANN